MKYSLPFKLPAHVAFLNSSDEKLAIRVAVRYQLLIVQSFVLGFPCFIITIFLLQHNLFDQFDYAMYLFFKKLRIAPKWKKC